MAGKKIYRITFLNQGEVYEVYAKSVSHGEMFGFVEVDDLLFGQKTQLVVDPSEERLKTEFAGVRRTFIPLQAVIRIDQVEKEGTGTIRAASGDGRNVSPFPVPAYPPGKEPGKKE